VLESVHLADQLAAATDELAGYPHLRDVEDRHGAEEDALLARLLALIVTLLDRDGGEDL